MENPSAHLSLPDVFVAVLPMRRHTLPFKGPYTGQNDRMTGLPSAVDIHSLSSEIGHQLNPSYLKLQSEVEGKGPKSVPHDGAGISV